MDPLFKPPYLNSNLTSSALQNCQGIYYSKKRACLYFISDQCFYAFESSHGKKGVAHIVSGVKLDESNTRSVQIKDGDLLSATFQFGSLTSIVEDSQGGFIVADGQKRLIRLVDLLKHRVVTIAGSVEEANSNQKPTGPFLLPTCAFYDDSGNLIVVDASWHRIISISPKKSITTLAGLEKSPGFEDGPSGVSRLNHPICAVSVPGVGIIFTDCRNNRIRRISKANVTSTIAGTGLRGTLDGPALSATFSDPTSLVTNTKGDIVVLEPTTKRIRLIRGGDVTTLVQPKMVNLPTKMTGLTVDNEGIFYISSQWGIMSYVPEDHVRSHWVESDSSASHLSFTASVSWRPLSASSLIKESAISPMSLVVVHPKTMSSAEEALRGTFELPLPALSRVYYLPLALVRLCCPALLESASFTTLYQLNISQPSIDILLDYLFGDKFPSPLTRENDWSTLIYLAALAKTLNQKPLFEHCSWLNILFCNSPGEAIWLANALRTAGSLLKTISSIKYVKPSALPDLEGIVDPLMKAVVHHNKLFESPEKIALLKGALPDAQNEKLKKMLQTNPVIFRPGDALFRARDEKPLLGFLPALLEKLWKSSISGTSSLQDSDISIEVSKNGAPHLIPCHLFVLHARWSFIHPMVHHCFKEIQDRKIQLLMPNGQLFDFSWASLFLRYLYTGDLSVIDNPEFADLTLEYADYLMLTLSTPGTPDHSSLIRHLEIAQSYNHPPS